MCPAAARCMSKDRSCRCSRRQTRAPRSRRGEGLITCEAGSPAVRIANHMSRLSHADSVSCCRCARLRTLAFASGETRAAMRHVLVMATVFMKCSGLPTRSFAENPADPHFQKVIAHGRRITAPLQLERAPYDGSCSFPSSSGASGASPGSPIRVRDHQRHRSCRFHAFHFCAIRNMARMRRCASLGVRFHQTPTPHDSTS